MTLLLPSRSNPNFTDAMFSHEILEPLGGVEFSSSNWKINSQTNIQASNGTLFDGIGLPGLNFAPDVTDPIAYFLSLNTSTGPGKLTVRVLQTGTDYALVFNLPKGNTRISFYLDGETVQGVNFALTKQPGGAGRQTNFVHTLGLASKTDPIAQNVQIVQNGITIGNTLTDLDTTGGGGTPLMITPLVAEQLGWGVWKALLETHELRDATPPFNKLRPAVGKRIQKIEGDIPPFPII